MNNDDNGSGLISGLVVGTGLAMILMAPFYLVNRFRAPVISFAGAVLATWLAFVGPSLSNAADGMSSPLSQVILEFGNTGWWKLAAIMWMGFFLTSLAHYVLAKPEGKL